jgi:DNA modification methylase
MTVRILVGEVLETLASLPAESIQSCITSPPYWGLRSYLPDDHPDKSKEIGLEPTLSEHIDKMVAVFAEVHRVLRKDGTLWLNYGDAYCSTDKWGGGGQNTGKQTIADDGKVPSWAVREKRQVQPGFKPKDLYMIPNRLAIALQEWGWWVRSEIIWAKPNPMPESIKDRPTSSHEKIWLLSKSARYFYDADAVRERAVALSIGDIDGGPQRDADGSNVNNGRNYRKPNTPSAIKSPYGQGFTRRAEETQSIGSKGNANGFRGGSYVNGEPGKRSEVGNGANETLSRNKRNVWTIATTPYSEAHFATFPPELPATCIKAGSRTGDMILDPFGGAGTSGLVADQLGRDAILIELNPEYAAMAERRIQSSAPLFAQVETTAPEKQLGLEESLSNVR